MYSIETSPSLSSKCDGNGVL